jgi:DNA polymerase-1
MEQGFNSLLRKLQDKSNTPLHSRERVPPKAAGEGYMNITPHPPSLRSGTFSLEGRRENVFVGEGNYRAIQSLDELKQYMAAARDKGILCFDTETNSLTPSTTKLVGLAFSHTMGEGMYVPLQHTEDAPQIPLADVIAAVKDILEDSAVLKIAHNAKFDWQVLSQHGVNVSPIDDTMLLSYVLDGTRHSHGMDALALLHLGMQSQSFESVCGKGKSQITFDRVPIAHATRYAAEDADITLRLWHVLKPRLPHEGMAALYETVERPLVQVIGRMEQAGIMIDPEHLHALSRKMSAQLEILANDIFAQAGGVFNIGSPKQLGETLFGKLNIPSGKKSKTGEWSTAADVLEPLASGYPIVEKVLEWRGLAKLQNTYADSLPEQIDKKTGRIHTSFMMAGTNTGRLSSTDPNLQNIPIRTDEGKEIRKAFVAPPGYKLVSVDYSQIELRLIAAMADIPALKKAFQNGADIHALTASEVLDIPLDKITADQRRSAKAINFGIIYGISGWGLAKQLGIGPGEANEIIKRYFMRFPELRDYMEARKIEARQQGYVTTLLGRKCMAEGIQDKNPARRAFAERQAINAPLQGTAADLMKRAMIAVDRWILENKIPARLLLQVHDELVLEARDDVAERVAAEVARIMQHQGEAAKIAVPLTAEASIDQAWE